MLRTGISQRSSSLQDECPQALEKLTPGDVGLDSLSEAELYLEVCDLLGISQIDSPESGMSFRDIVSHLHDRLDR